MYNTYIVIDLRRDKKMVNKFKFNEGQMPGYEDSGAASYAFWRSNVRIHLILDSVVTANSIKRLQFFQF
jgi:hypothetical protein